jgi:hypothetical protein
MKMAALTALRALPVSVAPEPPQRALSKICPPFTGLAPGMESGYHAYLRVSDDYNLGAGALLVVGRHSLDNSSGTLAGGAVIAGTAARGLSTASWIDDGLRACSRVGSLDLVDKATSSAISWADRSLTSTKDVDRRTALPLGELYGRSGGKASKGQGSGSELHDEGCDCSSGWMYRGRIVRWRADSVWAAGQGGI